MRARILKLHYKVAKKLLQLKSYAEKDGAYRVAKRLHAILLNHGGRTSGDISKLLQVDRSRVKTWLRKYEQLGYESVLEGQRTGRPPQLSEKQKSNLGDIIDSGPIAYGFLSGVWSSIMIARVIEEEFRVSYHPGHVRKVLYSLDFSLQRPKRHLAKADPNKQNRWTRYTYPTIKKSVVIARGITF